MNINIIIVQYIILCMTKFRSKESNNYWSGKNGKVKIAATIVARVPCLIKEITIFTI